MRCKYLSILLLCPLLTIPSLAPADDLQAKIVGKAFDSKSGELLYSELHFCADDQLECVVDYHDSFGQLIARKTLDFSGGVYQPALQMRDFRRSLEFSFSNNEREDLVVDAGFDNFVRSKWDELNEGEVVKFPFKVIGIDSPVKMRALIDPAGNCNEQQLCLKVSLDSWVLSMLVDPIMLSYSRQDRRLLRFQGVSNIKGVEGESLSVDIRYDYEDELLLVGPLFQQEPEKFSL
jgi:hypothetical protein